MDFLIGPYPNDLCSVASPCASVFISLGILLVKEPQGQPFLSVILVNSPALPYRYSVISIVLKDFSPFKENHLSYSILASEWQFAQLGH